MRGLLKRLEPNAPTSEGNAGYGAGGYGTGAYGGANPDPTELPAEPTMVHSAGVSLDAGSASVAEETGEALPTGRPMFNKWDVDLPPVAVGAPAASGPMDAAPEDASDPETVEAITESEAASTEPKIVHTASGDLPASNVSIGGEARISQAAVLSLASEAQVHAATARTGLFVNPELDRVEISHGDVVRADAVREHVETSLVKLEALKQELAGLRGCDEGGRRGDNEQVAPMTKESLDDLRALVDNIIALHGLSSFSRGHAQIIKSHTDYLHSAKEVFSSLPAKVKAGAHFVIVFEAACRALKGLYEILTALLR